MMQFWGGSALLYKKRSQSRGGRGGEAKISLTEPFPHMHISLQIINSLFSCNSPRLTVILQLYKFIPFKLMS